MSSASPQRAGGAGSAAAVDGVILEPSLFGAQAEPGAAVLIPEEGVESPPGNSGHKRDSKHGARGAKRQHGSQGSSKAIESWAEYEDKLTNWEKRMADFVDKWCRKCCPFKHCALHWEERRKSAAKKRQEQVAATESVGEGEAGTGGRGKRRAPRYSWWEGMSEHYPERYQRWEGIRERNTILSLAFGACGYGRKQPTKLERFHLFILYAAVWYLCYSITVRRNSEACHKAWAQTCVPVDQGGDCSSACAETEVLEKTPRNYKNFADVKERTSHTFDIAEAKCLGNSAVSSPCDIPMCAPPGSRACSGKEDAVEGFCYCDNWVKKILYSFVVYTICFKLLYVPFWYLMVVDMGAVCGQGVARLAIMVLVVIYAVLILISIGILTEYTNTPLAAAQITGEWFLSFVCLCLFEVVKGFSLAYVVGSYVIYPLFGPLASRLWKFALA